MNQTNSDTSRTIDFSVPLLRIQPLTAFETTTAAQSWRREPLFMPHVGPSPAQSGSAQEGGNRHSITSSARASSICGTVRPSALAVFWLMISWNLVGC